VDPDFALAFALVKTLRVPRLALDAAGAATLAKAYPSLAAVNDFIVKATRNVY
jgi:hypothetical protein